MFSQHSSNANPNLYILIKEISVFLILLGSFIFLIYAFFLINFSLKFINFTHFNMLYHVKIVCFIR